MHYFAAVPGTERSSSLAYLKVHAVPFLVTIQEVVRCPMVALGRLDQAHKEVIHCSHSFLDDFVLAPAPE